MLVLWLLVTLLLFQGLRSTTSISSIPLSNVPNQNTTARRTVRFVLLTGLFLFCGAWTATLGTLLLSPTRLTNWLSTYVPELVQKRFSYTSTLFIVDHSSSMEQPYTGQQNRLDAAKNIVTTLVHLQDKQNNGHDTVGLMECARLAPIQVPMTRDREYFFQKLQHISPENNEWLNGTALGYALFKGVYLMDAMWEYARENHLKILSKKARAIVIVTDGLEEVSPFDRNNAYRSIHMREALQEALASGIRVWYLVVAHPTTDLVSQTEQNVLSQLASKTGGGYIELLSPEDQKLQLPQIAEQIEQAKAPVEKELDFALLLACECILLCVFLSSVRWMEHIGCAVL